MLLHGVPQKALDVVSGMKLFMANNGLIKLFNFLNFFNTLSLLLRK